MANEKTEFDYRPDEPKAKGAKGSTRTISWVASEYIDHQRGPSWYFLLIAGTVALAALVYVISRDKFALVVILMLGIILSSVAHFKPKQVHYQVSPDGLQIDDKAYNFDQFKTFSIVHEGQLSSLVFHPLKKLGMPVSVFFDEDDEQKITNVVGEHLPLEERAPDRIDRLSRRLRF